MMKESNMHPFPFYSQSTQWDCGPVCLKMIAAHYGKEFNLHQMENWGIIKREGSSMTDIVDSAEKLGICATGLQVEITKLEFIDLPVILHWDKNHFVVLFNIVDKIYFIADPAIGILQLNELDFLNHWLDREIGNLEIGFLLMFSVIL